MRELDIDSKNALWSIMIAVGVKVLLTTGRTLSQGRAMELGKLTKAYFDAVSLCEVDKTTLTVLGIEAGDPIVVETDVGRVVVRSKLDRRAEPGIAFMPCGPYANAITGSDTANSGMPDFKTISASLFPAKGQPVLTVEEILDAMVRG